MGSYFSKSINYVSREEWTPVNPKTKIKFVLPLDMVYVARVENSKGVPLQSPYDVFKFLQDRQNTDMRVKLLPDIAYNFYVGPDGKIYEGRGWKCMPSIKEDKTLVENKTLAVAYILPSPGENPYSHMVGSMKALIDSGLKNEYIDQSYQLKGFTYGLLI